MDRLLREELTILHAQIYPGIGDPKRLLIIYALSREELCVKDLAAQLDLSVNAVSRHLMILRDHAMVNTRRENTTVYYSLADERIIQALDILRTILSDRLQKQIKLANFKALQASLESPDVE